MCPFGGVAQNGGEALLVKKMKSLVQYSWDMECMDLPPNLNRADKFSNLLRLLKTHL